MRSKYPPPPCKLLFNRSLYLIFIDIGTKLYHIQFRRRNVVIIPGRVTRPFRRMNNYRSLIQSPLFDGVSISDAACGEVRPIIVDHQFKGGIAEVEYRFIRFDPGQHLGASAEKQHVASCNQFFIDAVRFHPGNQRDVGVDDILSRKFCIQMVQSQDKLGKKRGGIGDPSHRISGLFDRLPDLENCAAPCLPVDEGVCLTDIAKSYFRHIYCR